MGIDPLDYRHPIVAPFRGRERAGLLTTPIARYHRLDLTASGPDVEVAAAVPGGVPLIVAAPVGRGRSVVVATDGSLTSVDVNTGQPWTSWPTWPSFLPIVREILAYAAIGSNARQYRVGDSLAGSISGPVGSTNLQIIRPDGRTDYVNLRNTPIGPQWTYEETDVSGFYTLRGAESPATFAVNVDTKESDLTKADSDSLPPDVKVHETLQSSDDGAVITHLSRAGWNRSLLWSALAILFAESLLAWQFGRATV
jgi:hypothetical protein